ncbi:IclR family transcriptional regulator [Kineosporia sp. J2-2]|uniref:IclR family transcriptional regulator n=1 Tax=Kineosporia corallincola TaxID=2835133 RepID=A0ABS5TKF7_9ACTN|nr:IclR family transcriptional regulator [Kineosporia corallincola]MBT0771589.1 IclR family transcriptional regulator [Kineosporia corallincola]
MAATASAPTVDAALRILSFLGTQRGPVAAVTLARALGLPRSSVYRLLSVLQERGFVLHYPDSRRYGLGIASFELGSGYTRQEPITRAGHPVLAALVDRVGESGQLAALYGRDVVYLADERAPGRPVLVTDVGVRLPSWLTASGRALLAALPREQVRALFPHASAFGASGPPYSYSRLRAELVTTRARGHAVENGEITEGLASVAVAVRDRTGWPVAGLAVTFPAGQADASQRGDLVAEVQRHAELLRQRLYG